jgi:hypothetical protein
MTESTCIRNRVAAAIAAGCAGLALAGAASAVDLRDWGRKVPVGERFIVLAQFSNQAVLDKETQLVWERAPHRYTLGWLSADEKCSSAPTGGRFGWRLPSRFELMSLLDPAASSSVKLPSGHPFVGVDPNLVYAPTTVFWTSNNSTDPFQDDYNVAVDIASAELFAGPPTQLEARPWCVRGHSE